MDYILPIPPLDGGRIRAGLLSEALAAPCRQLERFGFIIILLLALSYLLSKSILPIIKAANGLLLA